MQKIIYFLVTIHRSSVWCKIWCYNSIKCDFLLRLATTFAAIIALFTYVRTFPFILFQSEVKPICIKLLMCVWNLKRFNSFFICKFPYYERLCLSYSSVCALFSHRTYSSKLDIHYCHTDRFLGSICTSKS